VPVKGTVRSAKSVSVRRRVNRCTTNIYLICVCPPLPLGTQNGLEWGCYKIDERGVPLPSIFSVRPGYPGFLWLLYRWEYFSNDLWE
jgi:hypothetical protein